MVIKATIIKILFAEMYVNLVFVMFVQRRQAERQTHTHSG